MTSGLLSLATMIGVVGCASAGAPRGAPLSADTPWSVVAIRAPTRADVPFETSSRYLRPSEDANSVPGPDSLVAHARTNEEHRTYLELEDRRTGQTTRLLERGGSLPQWSPDGRFISCVVWKSMRQPHELTVVDVAERRVLVDPDIAASGTNVKWSPDSRTLAAAGVLTGRPRGVLYTVTIPGGAVRVLDSLDVLSDYEFSWSPDSRWIVFSRPTRLDPVGEDPTASDLWIADPASGETWRLLETPEWIESHPLWITDRSIQVERAPAEAVEDRVAERTVIDLRLDEARASP